jgi:prepilin-type N-terminal cleavage/methylation domain-containing protein
MRKNISHNSGFTILEIMVVVGIIGVLSGFVYPGISKWQTDKRISKDLHAVVNLIEYVAAKSKTVNGTGMIYCPSSNVLSYKISTYFLKPNASNKFVISADFTAGIIKDPRNPIGASPAKNLDHTVLSGKTNFLSNICTDPTSGLIINARNQSGVLGITRSVSGFNAFIHSISDPLPILAGSATLTGDDFLNHQSYKVSLSISNSGVSVNRRDYGTGSWECSEDYWADAKGSGSECIK